MAKKNLLAMVEGQAATGREIKGLVCKVVPDNEKYEVTEYEPEAERLVLTKIMPDGSEEKPEVLVITKANELVAHYAYNPNERPAPEAEIVDQSGKKILVLDNDKQIPMGTIKGIKVLGGKSGQVLFSVEGESEGTIDLWGYDVQFDQFYEVDNCYSPSVFMVNIDDSHSYLVENIIGKEPVLDENGNKQLDENGDVVTKPVFVSADIHNLFCYSGSESVRISVQRNQDYDDCYDEDDYDDVEYESQFGAPVISIRLVKQANRQDIVVITKSLEGNIRMQLFIDNDGVLGNRVGSFTINSADAKVFLGGSSEKPPVVTIKDDGIILIRTQRGLLVVDDTEVVDAMAGFDYFCGVYGSKDENDRDVAIWSYANADKSLVKQFTSVVTDRGTLFSVI